MKNQDNEVAVHAATVHMLETPDAASLTNEADGRLVRAATRTSQIKEAKVPGRKQLAPGRSTGPRTATGKEQSSRNAIKHGIYAKAVLLKGESRPQWQRLLRGFWEYFQPVGLFEELLVERLAIQEWRRGRMLRAENAAFERARGTAFTNTMASLQRMRRGQAVPPPINVNVDPTGHGTGDASQATPAALFLKGEER